MKVRETIFFDNRYFNSLEDFAQHIKKVMHEQSKKEELFALYISGAITRFCGLSVECDQIAGALVAIASFFGINDLELDVSEFLDLDSPLFLYDESIWHLCVDDDINTCSFVLKGLPKNEGEGDVALVMDYKVKRQTTECLYPLLSYYENNELKAQYQCREFIDLSKSTHHNSLSFLIPFDEFVSHIDGVYKLQIFSKSFIAIRVNRVGIDLYTSNGENVNSLELLNDYCNEIAGKQMGDSALQLYKVMCDGTLWAWLRSVDSLESAIKVRMANLFEQYGCLWDDLNGLMELLGHPDIVLPSVTMASPMVEDIDGLSMVSCVSKDGANFFVVSFSSESELRIKVSFKCESILPEFFELSVRIGDVISSKNILYKIDESTSITFVVPLSDFRNYKMGCYNIELLDHSHSLIVHTTSYLVLSGDIIKIPLSKDCELTMIGILDHKFFDTKKDYSHYAFYIAQSPLTQKQLSALLTDTCGRRVDKAIKCLSESICAHGNEDDFPVTHLTHDVCKMEILRELNCKFNQFHFEIPNAYQMVSTLKNGTEDYDVSTKNIISTYRAKTKDEILSLPILPVTESGTSKLGIWGLLGNISVVSYDINDIGCVAGFPCISNMDESRYIHHVSNYSMVGFRPIMKLKNY